MVLSMKNESGATKHVLTQYTKSKHCDASTKAMEIEANDGKKVQFDPQLRLCIDNFMLDEAQGQLSLKSEQYTIPSVKCSSFDSPVE